MTHRLRNRRDRGSLNINGDPNTFIEQQRWLKAQLAGDPARMRILRHIRALNISDCWVAAGFVRSLIWDRLHHRACSPLPDDIDVIWYDARHSHELVDHYLESSLSAMDAGVNWSVKNQHRMHTRNGDAAYESATQAMAYWPETATAVAVRLKSCGEIEIAAPFGLCDLFALVLRATPHFSGEKHKTFLDRVNSKQWLVKWPKLKFVRQDDATHP
jgi:hypothetical protein